MQQRAEINEFIRAHLHALGYTGPADFAENPIIWACAPFQGMESFMFAGIIVGLMSRGITPELCARYVIDSSFELPFVGAEGEIFDTLILAVMNRGVRLERVARSVEILAIMVDGLRRLRGMMSAGATVAVDMSTLAQARTREDCDA